MSEQDDMKGAACLVEAQSVSSSSQVGKDARKVRYQGVHEFCAHTADW